MGVSKESEWALKWSERSKVECNRASERVSGASGWRPVSSHDNRILKESRGRSLRLFARTAHSAHSLCSALISSLALFTGLLTLLTPSLDSWNSWKCVHAVNTFHVFHLHKKHALYHTWTVSLKTWVSYPMTLGAWEMNLGGKAVALPFGRTVKLALVIA